MVGLFINYYTFIESSFDCILSNHKKLASHSCFYVVITVKTVICPPKTSKYHSLILRHSFFLLSFFIGILFCIELMPDDILNDISY